MTPIRDRIDEADFLSRALDQAAAGRAPEAADTCESGKRRAARQYLTYNERTSALTRGPMVDAALKEAEREDKEQRKLRGPSASGDRG